MSGLWTPSGDQVPDSGQQVPDSGQQVPDSGQQVPDSGQQVPGSGAGPEPEWPGADNAPDQAEVEEELRRVRAEIARTPAVDIVANHAVGLWQLAVLHLNPEEGLAPRLDEAAVAIDAMGGMVDGLGDRLGDHAAPLREAVTQLRLAFVEVQRAATEGGSGSDAG